MRTSARRRAGTTAHPVPTLALALALLALGCAHPATTTVFYPHSTWDLLNPERGFVTDVDLVTGRDFAYVRAEGYTLGYAGVRLDAYRTSPLPPELLAALGAGFEAARAAGIKVVLRFVYNHGAGDADAPKAQILAHLQQLAPVLRANADVIAVMDAGFIGAWGEWHSSTNGLDNVRDRNDILAAVLAALPPSRSTMVRSPMYKVGAFTGRLTAAEAHDGSPASRVGHGNSCFLASDSDLGTYADPIDRWKDFIAEEGRYTPVGGETCRLNPPRTDCATATAELARLRWSFLNALYQRDVLDTWRDQGCYPQIARDLGYRIEIASATFDRAVAPGGVLHLRLRLANTGYAAMFNPRPVYLMLDDTPVATPIDPRTWQPGDEVTLDLRLRLPATLAAGRHRLALWLPDADPRLRRPDRVAAYSVRLANTRWVAPVNVLTDELIVAPAAPGPVDQAARRLALLP